MADHSNAEELVGSRAGYCSLAVGRKPGRHSADFQAMAGSSAARFLDDHFPDDRSTGDHLIGPGSACSLVVPGDFAAAVR
jgi:hypothetical protein